MYIYIYICCRTEGVQRKRRERSTGEILENCLVNPEKSSLVAEHLTYWRCRPPYPQGIRATFGSCIARRYDSTV